MNNELQTSEKKSKHQKRERLLKRCSRNKSGKRSNMFLNVKSIYTLQGRIQNPVKHLRWSILQK